MRATVEQINNKTIPDIENQMVNVETQLEHNIQQLDAKMDKNTTDISISQINKNLGKIDQTYLSDELLQQMTGTTPINAVVGDNSITTQKLASKSVNLSKFSTDVIKHIWKDLTQEWFTGGVSSTGEILNTKWDVRSRIIYFDEMLEVDLKEGKYDFFLLL